MKRVTAVILSIGTELTEGTIRDGHGQYLSSEFTLRGITVLRMEQLPDAPGVIKQFRLAAEEADLLVVTGGLGPTADDITRDLFARLIGKELELREEVWDTVVHRFPRLCGTANRRQALIPQGCEILDNPYGTAPGFAGTYKACHFFALPGPPRELYGMAKNHLLPRLGALFSIPPREVSEASVFLLGESRLEEACKEVYLSNPLLKELEWGTRVQERKISLYIRGGGEKERSRFLSSLGERMGKELIRMGNCSAEELLLKRLESSDLQFACAESCTGGMVGSLITSVAGSSRCFTGGVVAYSNGLKRQLLGVRSETLEREGAVSESCALEMAEGLLGLEGADIGCSVTGIAGPSGGSEEKPVGTVCFGLAGKGRESMSLTLQFGFNRESIRRRAAVSAMLLTEIFIDGNDGLDRYKFWQYS